VVQPAQNRIGTNRVGFSAAMARCQRPSGIAKYLRNALLRKFAEPTNIANRALLTIVGVGENLERRAGSPANIS
jgi:hypothetical protein